MNKEPRRTLDQNAKLHAMIGDLVKQRPEHFGAAMDADAWKGVLLFAIGKRVRFLPSLDGDQVVSIAPRTSKLNVSDFSDMIEQLYAKGAEWGIVWSEPDRWQHPRS